MSEECQGVPRSAKIERQNVVSSNIIILKNPVISHLFYIFSIEMECQGVPKWSAKECHSLHFFDIMYLDTNEELA